MGEAAPKGRTGKLGDTIRTTVRETAGGVTGTVRPGARYAGFVDKGSGLYAEHHSPIRAKAGKVLRFVDSSGQITYRAQVKGQPPQPFVERTRDEVAAEVQALLEEGAVKATEELF
jgi:hypothetical protein